MAEEKATLEVAIAKAKKVQEEMAALAKKLREEKERG